MQHQMSNMASKLENVSNKTTLNGSVKFLINFYKCASYIVFETYLIVYTSFSLLLFFEGVGLLKIKLFKK